MAGIDHQDPWFWLFVARQQAEQLMRSLDLCERRLNLERKKHGNESKDTNRGGATVAARRTKTKPYVPAKDAALGNRPDHDRARVARRDDEELASSKPGGH